MKASAKHYCRHAPYHMQTKLTVFRSSAPALHQIDNLHIPYNSPELLIFSKVNASNIASEFLRIQTCSCKLSLGPVYMEVRDPR